jgi:murein DD-endopeptidase MepM/ murein hydrolase activator NlpD
LLTLFVFYPVFANAGFFSLSVIFGEDGVQIEESKISEQELNSQNVRLLESAININPDPDMGGADINTVEDKALVAESGVGGSFVEISEKKNNKISVYEVKEGDTLSQIATMFDVSVNTIRWANDFEGSIQPGQTLVILPITGLKHTVKNGGTIGDIADIYNGDAREIALFNGISEDKYLEAGEIIIVPDAVKEAHSSSSSMAHSHSPSQSSASGGSSWLIRPIDGGYRSQGLHGYNAVDLAAKSGTPIYAAASGKVIVAKNSGWNGGYGLYIVIEHSNGVQTLYSHNSANYVKVGQWVEQGQRIAAVGNTGRTIGPTGNHVHFEVRGAKNPF